MIEILIRCIDSLLVLEAIFIFLLNIILLFLLIKEELEYAKSKDKKEVE